MTPAQILRVGHASTRCNTKALNQSAVMSFARGEHLVACITLRESARQLAEALIDYYAAWSARMKKCRTTAGMVKCLVSRGHISGPDSGVLYEAIVLGNRYAHCIRPKGLDDRLQPAINGMLALDAKFADILGDGDRGALDRDGCVPEGELKYGQ
jgi:hypothetical protein